MTSEARSQGDYFLWRLMVDAQYQSKGYAALAVKKWIERVRALPGAKSLITSHLRDNDHAGRFFQELGFSYTGEVLGDDDLLMQRDL